MSIGPLRMGRQSIDRLSIGPADSKSRAREQLRPVCPLPARKDFRTIAASTRPRTGAPERSAASSPAAAHGWRRIGAAPVWAAGLAVDFRAEAGARAASRADAAGA